jgi:hypothetical protein
MHEGAMMDLEQLKLILETVSTLGDNVKYVVYICIALDVLRLIVNASVGLFVVTALYRLFMRLIEKSNNEPGEGTDDYGPY